MGWIEQLNLPPNSFVGDWPSPEGSEFWEFAYYDEVAAILADQVPKYAKDKPELQRALATCYIWISSMAEPINDETIKATLEKPELLSPSKIYLIFNGPMTDFVLEQLGIKPPPSKVPFHTYLENQPNFREKVEKLSPGMQAFAWWSTWASFDSQIRKASNEILIDQPTSLPQKEVVSFMQEKLGLKPPALL